MKKAFLLLAVFLPLGLAAQWTDSGSNLTTMDKVGIGTTSPNDKLVVRDGRIIVSEGSDRLFLKVEDSIARSLIGFGDNPSDRLGFYFDHWDGTANDEELVSILSDGKVGIGVTNPDSKLHLRIPGDTGTIASYPTTTGKGDVAQSIRSNNNGIEIGNSTQNNDRKAWILARHANATSYGDKYATLHLQPDVGSKTFYQGVAIGYTAATAVPTGTHMAINGKVGVGTLNPDAKLTVNGDIHTKEVRVDLDGVFAPDYVFAADYDLKSLEEVQNYIQEHGHLPNIPSAREMEEHGLLLKEMNLKLLEKIEELTLYLINQEKAIEGLKQQNDFLLKYIKKE